MLRLSTRLGTALVCCLVASVALATTAAASGGAHADVGPDWSAIVRHAVNLVLFFGILAWALRTPLGNFLMQRRAEVKDQLDAAWTAKTEAEKQYRTLEARITDFEGELEKMMATVREDANSQRKAIEERAARSAAQLQEATRRTIDDELRRARHLLRTEAIELAVDLAGRSLTESVDKKDQDRLASSYLDQVKESHQR